MPRSTKAWLGDIKAACDDLRGMASGRDVAEFGHYLAADPIRFRAVKNAFAELGEAIKHLPGELISQHLDVDWKGLAGLRDVVAHSYFRVRAGRLHEIIATDLVPLLEVVNDEIARTENSAPKSP